MCQVLLTRSYRYNYYNGKVSFFDRNNTFYNEYHNSKHAKTGSYITNSNESEIHGTNSRYAMLTGTSEANGRDRTIAYTRFLKNCTSTGSMMFWKAYFIWEDERRDENDNQIDVNEYNYRYLVDGDLEYDGYPSYKREGTIGSSVRYKVEVKEQGLVTNTVATQLYNFKYLGSNEGQTALVDTVTNTGVNHKITTAYQYDSATKLTTQVLTNTYDSPSSSTYMTTQEDFTYDTANYGDVLTDKMANDINRTITFTYHPTYHYLLTKTYKADSSTAYREEYTPTPDGKSPEWYKVYENYVNASSVPKKKVQYGYDSSGNVINKKEYLDNQTDYVETQFSYTDNVAARSGKFNGVFMTQKTVKAVKDADNANSHDVTENYYYNWFGQQTQKTDAKGFIYKADFDKLGRPTKVYNPDHTTANPSFKGYVYEDGGQVVKLTDELGNTTSVEYDTSGNLLHTSQGSVPWNASNMLTETWYNFHNQPAKEITYSDKGNTTTTTYGYDSLRRPTHKEILGNANAVIYREDYAYNIVTEGSAKYAKETVTTTGDSSAPSIVKSIFKDIYGDTVKIQTGTDVETAVYDWLGRNTQKKSARANNEAWSEAFTDKFEYDYQGKVIKQTTVSGAFAKAQFDTLGRQTRAYDFEGAKSAKDYYTEYKYDNLGRVVEVKTPFEKNGNVVSYSLKRTYYDDNGNVTKEKQTNNAVGTAESWQEVNYAYDNRNRLIKTTSNDGVKDSITQNYYDKASNLRRVYSGLSAPLTINGLDSVTAGSDADYAVTKYEYDAWSRVTDITDALNQTEHLSYDKKGTNTGKTDRNGNVFSFTYDGFNNLSEKAVMVNNAKTEVITSGYGKNGQITSSGNSAGTISYVYDNHGRLYTETNTADNTVKMI